MNTPLLDMEAELQELAAIQAESIGWLPLGEGTYLHVANPDAPVIMVVGVPASAPQGANVLLLG